METIFEVVKIDKSGNIWARNLTIPHENMEVIGSAFDLPTVERGQKLVRKNDPLPDLGELDI